MCVLVLKCYAYHFIRLCCCENAPLYCDHSSNYDYGEINANANSNADSHADAAHVDPDIHADVNDNAQRDVKPPKSPNNPDIHADVNDNAQRDVKPPKSPINPDSPIYSDISDNEIEILN